MKVFIVLVLSLAITAAAAEPVVQCRQDLLISLADIFVPDDVMTLVDQVKQSVGDKALASIEKDQIKGKFSAPDECGDYIDVIDALMKSHSCEKVNGDEKLTQEFWSAIPKGSSLDTFLGAHKICVYATNVE